MSVLYQQFFRNFVLRKKQEITNPKFHHLTDMVLPRESVMMYLPKTQEDIGPSTEEPLIGTYPDGVNIYFNSLYVTPIGRTRPVPFNEKQSIQLYRKSHFKYNWARTLSNYLSRRQELLVNNIAMGPHRHRYVFTRFVQFERAYNQLASGIEAVKQMSKETTRYQYWRIELPPSVPDYRQLLVAVDHYKKAFKDGVYTTTDNQAVLPFKGYGSYWIMDWYLFLIGERDYSLFNRLDKEEMDKLHIIFSHNGLSWVVNLGIVSQWMEELNDKQGNPTSMRVNAAKRFLLGFRALIAGGTLSETIEEKPHAAENVGLGTGTPEEERRSQEVNKESEEEPLDLDESEEITDQSVTMLDLFMGSKKADTESDDDQGGEDPGGADENHGEEWAAAVDDELLYNAETEGLGETKKVIFSTPESGILRALEQRAKAGTLTVAEQRYYTNLAQSYKTIKMPNGESLESFVKIDQAKLRHLPAKVAPEMRGIIDPSQLQSRATNLKTKYSEEFLNRDIAGMILNVQNAGIVLTDLKRERIVNAESAYDVYTMNVHPVGGSPKTAMFRIPKIDKDGTFTVDGVKQHLQLQRMEIPIRKINSEQVALTSYYDRKIMMSRSTKVADDYGLWLNKQLILLGEAGKVSGVLGDVYNRSYAVPRTYSALAKRYRTLKAGGIEFNFDLSSLVGSEKEIKKLISPNWVPVAKEGDGFIFMDDGGNLYKDKTHIGSFESRCGIDTTKAPVDIVTVNVNGYAFPIGVVLAYYFGFDELLKALNADYRTVPAGEKVRMGQDEYAITFNDETLIFNRRDSLTALIMGGFRKLANLSNFSRYDLNTKGVWVPAIGDKKVKPGHFDEMRLMFEMFIDPITKSELVKRGYPTELHYLMIEGVKMLNTDRTAHEIELTEQRFVGYERFAGRVYNEIVKSTRQFRNKGNDKRFTFDMNPEAVIMSIITDTSVNLVEEVNPIHEIKEQEVVTFGGTGGRSETTMVRRTRGQQENYAGVISEAGKDSGKVGFVSYLTSNPKIADFRGNVDLNMPDTLSGRLSVTSNLLAHSTSDDPKRSLFSGVQQSQGVSATNYQTNWLRTGDELVIAHRTSELYSKPAKLDGKVIKLTKEGLVVEYKDGTTDSYPLGLTIGSASGEFHRHTRVTDLKVGDSFNAGDIIGWDEMYFERDLANPNQVAWKCGVMVRIAFVENQFTFEDSIEVSKDFAEQTKTPYLKLKEFSLDFEQTLVPHVEVGSEVDMDAILCSIEDPHVSGLDDSDDTFSGLERLGVKQIRSNHHGRVVKIECVYNGSIEDMSDSLKGFVTKLDKERQQLNKVTHTGIVNGNVGGNTYVKKASVEPNRVTVKIFIEDLNSSETADKFVVGNQMKGTVGNIVNYTMRTLDGRIVKIRFSFKSMFNRMVLSLRDKMGINEVNANRTSAAVKAFRGK